MKNTMGGTGMPTYAVGNPGVDTLYTDGVRSTNMNSFYVPVMWQQRLAERWLLEGGIQTGLIYETEDEFDVTTTDGGKLAYTRDATDDFVRMDVGLVAGLGFKFTKQPKSVSAGALYYHGLVDMDRSDARTITNSSFYFYIRIPIGVGFDEKADN